MQHGKIKIQLKIKKVLLIKNYFQNYIINNSSIFNVIQNENILGYYEIITQNYLSNISSFQNIFSLHWFKSKKSNLFKYKKRI